jgi:hypothetical protein
MAGRCNTAIPRARAIDYGLIAVSQIASSLQRQIQVKICRKWAGGDHGERRVRDFNGVLGRGDTAPLKLKVVVHFYAKKGPAPPPR